MRTSYKYSQKTKAPAIIPLAMAAGKRRCASCVKGYDSAANSAGGITNLSLTAC